jgi:chlorobactene glucosyltransferase
MISAWPRLTMLSFWERALMPMLNVVTFSLFPAPLSFRRDDPSLGLVHGACLLVQRAAYERIGGHTAVRNEIFEDQRLARLWRARGERGFCLDGIDTVAVRMYSTLDEIWRGFQKNFYPAFAREISFWTYLLFHALTFTVPMALGLLAPSWVAAAALAAMLTARVLLARRFRHPVWTVLLHPLAEAVLFGIALASWGRCRSGRGVEWKDRRYLAGLVR